MVRSVSQTAPVAQLSSDARQAFLFKTYAHLCGAMCVFALVEIALFKLGYAETIARTMARAPWLLILGAFMLVGWLSTRAAHTVRSVFVQYLALAAFVAAQAVIFIPLLFMAEFRAPGTIASAAYLTLGGFGALTLLALFSGRDFSFLGALLKWGGICAVLGIVAAVAFGFELGTWFSVGMIAFAGAAVLYDTSRILNHYPEDRAVGAALELFGSVAMMFWYVLRLLNSRR
jgi:FtsH-binding integral membrane protein